MANLQIGFGPNIVGAVALVGKDDTATIRGLTGVTVTLADSTNAYIADAKNGQNTFYIIPRQNAGGAPLTALTTVTVTITGKDPTLGGSLPPIALGFDLGLEPPPPPHTTVMSVQTANPVTLATVPADPGTLTINLT